MFAQRYDNVFGTFLEPMLLECFQNVIMQRYTITFCKPYKKLSAIDVPITLQSNVVGTFLEPMLYTVLFYVSLKCDVISILSK